MQLAEYDSSTNKLYAVSDLGALFEGVPDSANWHPLNDQLKFTNGGIKIIPNGTKHRLIITAGLNTYYIDNDGATYEPSSGFKFPIEWGGNNTEQIAAADDSKHTLYCIVLEWDPDQWKPLYYLYRSTNQGAKWTKIYTFSEGNEQEVALWSPPGKNFIYALENVDGVSTTLYKIQGASVTSLNPISPLSNYAPLQFKGIIENNKTIFYTLIKTGEFYKSTDFGKSWNYVNSNSEIEPVFGISLVDSNAVVLGGVPNCFVSHDGGQNLSLVNDWTEYYGNVANKLHGDDRSIYFFRRSNGNQFAIILCDGGVYRSDDFLNTVHNISLKGLNVGEFYDVLSDPTDSSWLFGGTQDQGFQRASNLSTQGVVDFKQVISGDYGHLQLTNNSKTLWIEYPGGRFDYYNNSHGGNVSNNS